MKSRILLKEIPYGKFHSAIFTTFSFSFYYFEQQVLPLLGSKGIHYISALVDGNMLNNQLEGYCLLSEQRKRNYAIHGIQSNGAFHPKLILLAGETSLLLLIGSGNLTSSGHGKNLETWNAIYINTYTDTKIGFVIQAWKYIKSLHNDLGVSAQQKLKTIEENCSLLNNIDKIILLDSYDIDDKKKISFLSTGSGNSLINQLSSIISNEKIERITIQSPFYDINGKFIHMLNNTFNPEVINIILQENFGTIPTGMKPASNMYFYNWKDVVTEDLKQEFFHAKNIIFEGKKLDYLLSGSANASMAAFASSENAIVNHEACVFYHGKDTDFVSLLGLKLTNKKVKLSEFESQIFKDNHAITESKKIVFIKAIEKWFDILTIYFSSKRRIEEITICMFNSKGEIEFKQEIDINKGESSFQLSIPPEIYILYGVLTINSAGVSNKQFVIDITAFEGANPSPRNRTLNQIRKLIEGGTFSTTKIIEYLSTIHKQKYNRKTIISKGSSNKKNKDEIIIEEESDLLYLSYEEIQRKAKKLDNTVKGKGYVEYNSVRLWESIFSYLRETKQKKEQVSIDEEETEDINSSTGRNEDDKVKEERPISKSNYDKLKVRIEKFFSNYLDVLESKLNDKKADKPSLIDLSMYLIMIEIILHLLSHKEIIKNTKGEELRKEHLIPLAFSNSNYSISEYIIKFVGLFTLWCTHKGGFKEVESEEYKLKLELYKKMAFKSSTSALALFSVINEKYKQEKIEVWKKLGLLNVYKCFNTENKIYKNIEEFDEFVPEDSKEQVGEFILSEELSSCLAFTNKPISLKSLPVMNSFYLHPEHGYTYINKEITNLKNSNIRYLKLINIGYGWNEDISDFWNGKVYNFRESRWISVLKE